MIMFLSCYCRLCRYYGECDLDSHCSYSTACYNNYCRDPCIGACGYNANCRVSPQ